MGKCKEIMDNIHKQNQSINAAIQQGVGYKCEVHDG